MAQLPQLIHVPPVTYLLVAGALAIIYLFPRLTKMVPSPLVAIIVLTIITVYGGIHVNTVGDMGKLPTSLPTFHFPQVPLTLETLRIILPFSLTMAAVGLLDPASRTKSRPRSARPATDGTMSALSQTPIQPSSAKVVLGRYPIRTPSPLLGISRQDF